MELTRTIQPRKHWISVLVPRRPPRRSPQIRGDYKRKPTPKLFQSTVYLPSDVCHLLCRIDVDFARKRRLCPAHEASEHLASLSRVVVDGLLAHNDDIDAVRLAFDDRLKGLGDTKRLGGGRGLGYLDVDGRVGAHSERCPEGLGGFRGADGDDLDRHDGVFEAFAHPDGLFHRYTKGVCPSANSIGGEGQRDTPISSNGFWTEIGDE